MIVPPLDAGERGSVVAEGGGPCALVVPTRQTSRQQRRSTCCLVKRAERVLAERVLANEERGTVVKLFIIAALRLRRVRIERERDRGFNPVGDGDSLLGLKRPA